MESKIITNDLQGLNTLVKALSNNLVIKVGMLGQKGASHFAAGFSAKGKRIKTKEAAGVSNAELGAIHELGSFSKGIVPRSWLRAPLHKQSAIIVGEAAKASKDLVKEGNMMPVLRKIGVACISAIQRAFASRGFGEWKEDAPATVRAKRSSAPLIDTGQMRRAVSFSIGKPS